MDDFPHGAQHSLGLARLEEFDHPQRRCHVREQAFQIVDPGGRRVAAGRLERAGVGAARQRQLVQHQHDRMAQLQRSVSRIGRDRDDAMAGVERLVRQPLVLTPEQQSDRAHLRLREQLRRGLARTLPVAFGAALPRREPDDVHAVGERLVQPLVLRDPRQDVPRLVRDALDPVAVELAGAHEPQVAEAEILERPDDVGNVDEILGLVEDDDDAHRSDDPNAECGVRNAECKGGRREASDRPLLFRIPHSPFRIGLTPPAPVSRTAPDPADPRAATPSRSPRSRRAGPPGARGRGASR